MSRTQVTFAILGFLLVAGQEVARAQEGEADSARRTWAARKGGYKTQATLVRFKDGVVRLQREDGTFVSLPIDKLSEADQEYVKKWAGGVKATEDAPQPKPDDVGETSEMVVKCQRLCEDLTKSYKGKETGGKATIAVVEFSDLSGGVTDFGRLLSEELITKMFATGKYKVIERLLLNKAIAEHKLQLQGIVDPKSAKELGKILGVDAIVSGTIATLGTSLRVNARLISTETGEVLSVAAVTIVKDEAITKLVTDSGEATRSEHGKSGGALPKGQPAKLPLHEDFLQYEDNDETDWGPGGKVRAGADGRRWLVPAGIGSKPVGRDVQLPQNAYIELDYNARKLKGEHNREKVLSGVSLVDETGAKYRIELEIEVTDVWATYTLTLPGGTSKTSECSDRYFSNSIILNKKGDVISVRVKDGTELTGDVGDFKTFTRLELDLYKGPNSSIAFTNIKIGSLGTRDGTGVGPKVPSPRKGVRR